MAWRIIVLLGGQIIEVEIYGDEDYDSPIKDVVLEDKSLDDKLLDFGPAGDLSGNVFASEGKDISDSGAYYGRIVDSRFVEGSGYAVEESSDEEDLSDIDLYNDYNKEEDQAISEADIPPPPVLFDKKEEEEMQTTDVDNAECDEKEEPLSRKHIVPPSASPPPSVCR
jgi:hypothetical protein